MVSENIKIVLRYPNGFRETFFGRYDGQVLYRCINIPFLYPKLEGFELDYDHVGFKKNGIGKLFGLPLYEKVVDVDFNAASTMGIIEVLTGRVENRVFGKSIRTDIDRYVDYKKKNFFRGIALGEYIEREGQNFDPYTLLGGMGIGILLFKIIQGLLLTQGIVI